MAVFTALGRDDIERFTAHYEVGTLAEAEAIAAGIENTNYFVTTTTGRYVLTVFERLTFRELPFYLELMLHCALHALPVPAPQRNRSGALMGELKGKPAALVTRLPGRSVEAPTIAQCEQVGRFLARLHLAAREFPLFQPHLRGIGWWKSTLPKLEPFLPEHAFRDLAEEVVFQDSFFRSAVFEQLPSGPIHADLFRDNVLFDGGAIGGVIDFYFAGCSIWLFDLAVTINDWCVDLDSGAFDLPRAQALVQAYHAERPLTEAEHACWRTVLRAAALRFWLSRLDDLHRPRDAHLLKPHDPTRFERMLQRRRSDAPLPWPV
jgi:homoserine kinase type II